MEDCRIGKELKQSTCRYVKKCQPGWSRNKKFICRKTIRRLEKSKKKSRVGNFITYTHPDGRKEIAKITKIKENGSYELFIPSLSKAGLFQKNEMVEYLHTNGEREKARITKVNGNMYEIFLVISQIYKIVKPIKLRKLSNELPAYYNQTRKLYNEDST